MNNRERIINTVLCKDIDRPPFTFYFGPWDETLERWKSEGLDENKNWDDDMGFDAGIVHVNINLGYYPAFEYEEIEDKGDTRIIRDKFGILQEVNKHGACIPKYIDYPVKEPEDWKKLIKEKLNPDSAGRFPENWGELGKTI